MQISYSKKGIPVADHKAMEYAKILKTSDLIVSTENVITCARILIKQGELPADTEFYFDKEKIEQVEDTPYKFKFWPEGFCDNNLKWLPLLAKKEKND